MRNFNFYSLLVMVISALITWKAIAIPNIKIHLIDNLDPTESHLAHQIIEHKGYQLSNQKLFDESKEVVMITKTLANESEPASIHLEVLYQANAKALPKTVFNLKLETKDISEILEKLPSPEKLEQSLNHPIDTSSPVAYQNW